MSVIFNFFTSGMLKKVQLMLPKLLFVLCYITYINAEISRSPLDAPLMAPKNAPFMTPNIHLPLPAELPLFHRPQRIHLSPQGAVKVVPAPAQSPYYGPLITAGHPPTSSQLSKPSMKKIGLARPSPGLGPPLMLDVAPSSNGVIAQPPLSPYVSNCCKPGMVLKRGSQGCHCVYPIQLDLLLLNVSPNPNWNVFLEELATQLGLRGSQIELINFYVISLSKLNISMDITPHTGIGFSAGAAAAINSSLKMHKVQLDPTLVGDYKLLNLTWFRPPSPSQAPIVAAAPVDTPRHKPSSTPDNSKKTNHSYLTLIIGIGVGLLIIAIVSVLIICSCTSSQDDTKICSEVTAKPKTTTTVVRIGSSPHLTSTRFLEYEELKEATNNFECGSILGEGGFGKVFKGVLSDGTAVAIKRLQCGSFQGDKEFLCEVEMLSRLHHRNLVKLVGYHTSRNTAQNLLCYELVPKGSLEAWLHGPEGVRCPLDWDTRMKIALDAARGLAYLHEDSQPCVIHRDFKASNILLENDFHAKVADFGLAKQAPVGRESYLSTRVMGTFGYVAPEYAMTGHLLVKSDVYSYGVVLLELLTGRKPVEMSQPSGQENLVTWARPILRDKDRLEELGDPRLGKKYPNEDFIRVCTIAAACVAPEANQRPTMGEVVQSLKMVQRVTEHQDPTTLTSSNTQPNLRQSSATFESDGTSSMFSSGYSGSVFDIDNLNLTRTAVFSEDLHEGR